jgi:hypothetical protein
LNDVEITTIIRNLSRPHASGGVVIERAAILAAGRDSPEIIDWIISHEGAPEMPATRSRGLHGSHLDQGQDGASSKPTRFVIPAGALSAQSGAGVVSNGATPARNLAS